MESLKWLREQGELMNETDRSELEKLTVEDSLKIFALLYRNGLVLLEGNKDIFRSEREKYLKELQSRLYRIGKWEKRRERSLRQRRKTPKAPRKV